MKLRNYIKSSLINFIALFVTLTLTMVVMDAPVGCLSNTLLIVLIVRSGVLYIKFAFSVISAGEIIAYRWRRADRRYDK